MKTKLKRSLAVASMLALVSSVPVMAAGYSDSYGSAKLNVNYANGYRKVSASTERAKTRYSSFLRVITTYVNGTYDTYESGVVRDDTYYSHDWEDAEDYTSNHRILYSGSALLNESFTEQ